MAVDRSWHFVEDDPMNAFTVRPPLPHEILSEDERLDTPGGVEPLVLEFDEEKVERDEDGEFASKAGSGAKKSAKKSSSYESDDVATMAYLRTKPEPQFREPFNVARREAGQPELSEAEFHVLRNFLGDSYAELNYPLRRGGFIMTKNGVDSVKSSGKKMEGLLGATRTINNALNKMPVYEGEVKRVAKVSEEKLQQMLSIYKPGEMFVEKGLVSASEKDSPPIKTSGLFTGEPNVVYSIQSKTGRSVAEKYLVGHPEEREVLFKVGTTFRTDSIKVIPAHEVEREHWAPHGSYMRLVQVPETYKISLTEM